MYSSHIVARNIKESLRLQQSDMSLMQIVRKLHVSKTQDVLKERNMEFIEFERKGLKDQRIITSKSKSFIQYL